MIIFQLDRYILEKQVRLLSKFITGTVLDVGAGSFSRYRHLISSNKYITMDVKNKPGVDIVASIEHIPLEDGVCDSIVCTQVLEHVQNPFTAAEELYRVLRSSGHCLVTVPQTSELHEEPNDFFRYTRFGIVGIFEKAGFETVEVSQRGGFFSTIAQEWSRYFINRFLLYHKPILGRFMSHLLYIFGQFAMVLDKIDTGSANRKHAIGWAVVFKKP